MVLASTGPIVQLAMLISILRQAACAAPMTATVSPRHELRPMRPIVIIAALLIATPASARIVAVWECTGDSRSQPITVELHKYATAAYELRFSGILYVWGTGHGYNFKYVGQESAVKKVLRHRVR